MPTSTPTRCETTTHTSKSPTSAKAFWLLMRTQNAVCHEVRARGTVLGARKAQKRRQFCTLHGPWRAHGTQARVRFHKPRRKCCRTVPPEQACEAGPSKSHARLIKAGKPSPSDEPKHALQERNLDGIRDRVRFDNRMDASTPNSASARNRVRGGALHDHDCG